MNGDVIDSGRHYYKIERTIMAISLFFALDTYTCNVTITMIFTVQTFSQNYKKIKWFEIIMLYCKERSACFNLLKCEKLLLHNVSHSQ